MRVVIARPMPELSMDVYADNLASALRAVRPAWQIIELVPAPLDRHSRSSGVRLRKLHERFWRFPRRVARHAADVVHVTDAAEAHIARWLRRRATPTVVTCHDLINYVYPENRVASVQMPVISHRLWLYAIGGMRAADHIVAPSSVTADDTRRLLGIEPARITVAANGVDSSFRALPAARRAAIRQEYGLPTAHFCLLNVGSNHRRKNLGTALHAVAIARRMGVPLRFLKAGAPFTADQARLIARLQLADVVRYVGMPDRAALVDLYNAADALMAPSLFEGFGLTLLESMACGTPVITSNVSAMPEVVGDAAVLVDPARPDAIADAIAGLHRDPALRARLVDQGVARARSFTWERTASIVAGVYERLVAATRRGPRRPEAG